MGNDLPPCPKCDWVIRVNMARHLRLCHTTYVCFWRCPVSTCLLWFTSELNGKDHIERTHRFREGRRCSFYECLKTYGLEWFGSWSFFDQRKLATQSLWMDLALARHSSQELHNKYIITQSPEFALLRRFFMVAVNQVQLVFNDLPVHSKQPYMPSKNPLLEMTHRQGTVWHSSRHWRSLALPPYRSAHHRQFLQWMTSHRQFRSPVV